MTRLSEIETRLAEIKTAVNVEGADIDALNTETDALISERQALLDAEEKRQAILSNVAKTEGEKIMNTEVITEVREMSIDSLEYRNAWLNNLRGLELNESEKRAFATTNGAIATMTVNDIMEVVKDHAPLLDKLTVVRTGAIIKYYVEGVNNAASAHTENAAITPEADTVTPITLTPSEITKMLQISEAAKQMSVDAFEAWVAKNLGEAIAAKINALIITAITPSVSVANTIDAANVRLLLGSVKGNVSLVVNRKTLYTKLLPLQDNSKNPLVRFDGGAAYVYGSPVFVDDNCTDDVVIAGDLSKAVAALGENVVVRNQYDINTNSYKYLGVALFDVKVGVASAFASIA